MKKNPIETVLGFCVLTFTIFFLFFALGKVNVRSVSGYQLTANFSKIGGLQVGSDVRISGVKVGSVLKTQLNPQTYTADVILTISSDVHLPVDTAASISDAGIMGDKYIRLDPGQSTQMLKNNDKITATKNYKSFEDNISDFIFLSTN